MSFTIIRLLLLYYYCRCWSWGEAALLLSCMSELLLYADYYYYCCVLGWAVFLCYADCFVPLQASCMMFVLRCETLDVTVDMCTCM